MLKHSILALLISILIMPLTYASDGDRKVRFIGGLTEDSFKRISVRDLESHFKLHTVEVYNPWDKKTATYTGILISDLITKVGLPDIQEITIKAIDDYQIQITKNTWQEYRILLVTQENGQYIPVKNKGPLRIVFPDYDASQKEYELNLPLWMWMINRIELK